MPRVSAFTSGNNNDQLKGQFSATIVLVSTNGLPTAGFYFGVVMENCFLFMTNSPFSFSEPRYQYTFVGNLEEFKNFIKNKDGEYLETTQDPRSGSKMDRKTN